MQPPHTSDGQGAASARIRRSGCSLRTHLTVRVQPPHRSLHLTAPPDDVDELRRGGVGNRKSSGGAC
eukprot:2001221-Pyramimonas_sp.AAC.1